MEFNSDSKSFCVNNPEEIIKNRSLWILNINNKEIKGLIEYLFKHKEYKLIKVKNTANSNNLLN